MPDLEHSQVQGMSAIERSQALINVAMKSPDHLKEWLEESGRRWLVFNGLELVDALPWPHGIKDLLHMIMCYRDHRSTIQTGHFEEQQVKNQLTGQFEAVRVPLMKGETLELEELDRAIRYLIEQASRKDPSWSLDNPPL